MSLNGRRWPYTEPRVGGRVMWTRHDRRPTRPNMLVFRLHLPESFVLILGLEIESWWCLWVGQRPGTLLPAFVDTAGPVLRYLWKNQYWPVRPV